MEDLWPSWEHLHMLSKTSPVIAKMQIVGHPKQKQGAEEPGGAAKPDERFTLMFHGVIQGNSCVSLSTTGPIRITRDRVIGVLTKSANDDRSFI